MLRHRQRLYPAARVEHSLVPLRLPVDGAASLRMAAVRNSHRKLHSQALMIRAMHTCPYSCSSRSFEPCHSLRTPYPPPSRQRVRWPEARLSVRASRERKSLAYAIHRVERLFGDLDALGRDIVYLSDALLGGGRQ